ncbi:hypothetical protein [Longispora albida]|uniref:hypothetical protein n=1 Tax=Longispora albida TaxID=203523 RepID=UPI0004771AE2|nr:hypothetical protein [Longispora albida]
MKVYAELPARRTRQIVSDLCALAWAALWGWVAYLIHQTIQELNRVTQAVTKDGTRLEGSLNGAADSARDIPLVGKTLGQKLADAAGVAQSIAKSGQEGTETIGQVALFAAIAVVVGAVVPVLALWLFLRVRWVYRARTAVRLRDLPGGLDLLALRALSSATLKQLTRADPDPAGGWRSGDEGTIGRLALLELATLGLRSR